MGDLPGSQVVKTLLFYCMRMGLIPGKGTEIPHATRHIEKKKRNGLFI